MPVTFYRVILAFGIVTSCQPGYGQNISFTKSPGIVRTDVKEKARFRWTLLEPLDPTIDTRIDYMYGNTKICSSIHTIVGYPGFRENVSCFTNTSFELLTITEFFTKQPFSINITVKREDGSDSYQNTNASLFIYRKPLIQTDYLINITKGDSVNVTCNATSTSLPVAHRLPITFKWTHNKEPITNLAGSPFEISGPSNGSLTITDIQPTHSDIACIATEYGSTVESIQNVVLDIQECASCGVDYQLKEDDTIVVNAGFAWILGGIAIFIFVVLLAVIGYLVWERKHKPERSRRRSRAVRLSLGRQLSLPRRGHHRHKNVYSYKDSVSDSDSDHYYAVIPSSRVASTIDGNACPTLPERDPKMMPSIAQGDPGCYDYADARMYPFKLNSALSPNQNKQVRTSDIYGEDTDKADERVQKDVDGYMIGDDIALGPLNSDSKSHPVPAMDEYAVVDKSKKTTTSVLDMDQDIVECPTYIPIEENTSETERTDQVGKKEDPEQSVLPAPISEHSENQPITDLDADDEYSLAGSNRSDSHIAPNDNSFRSDLYNLAEADDKNTNDDVLDLHNDDTKKAGVDLKELSMDANSNASNLDLHNLADESQDRIDSDGQGPDLYNMAKET